MRLNNIDVAQLETAVRTAKAGTKNTRMVQKVPVEWQTAEGAPQFRSIASYAGGQLVMETDMSKDMGGGGLLPGPMRFAFFGLAASYAGAFAQAVSLMGLELHQFTLTVEAPMNMARTYGASDAPIFEEVRFTISVKSNASKEQLAQAQSLALERAPGVYALRAPLKVTSQLEVIA